MTIRTRPVAAKAMLPLLGLLGAVAIACAQTEISSTADASELHIHETIGDRGPCLVRYPTPEEIAAGPESDELPTTHIGPPWRIVLRMIVMRRSNGTGGMTDLSMIDKMMQDLNYGFRNTPIQFVRLPGVEYLDSDAYYTMDNIAEAHTMFGQNHMPGIVNIFFSEQRLFGAIAARAYTSAFSPRGHIFADDVGLPYDTPFPPHELGHLLWLYHPYEPQFGTECVARTNCASAGDLICETPASPIIFNGNTTANGHYYGAAPGPCPGDPVYAPRTDLIMDSGWSPGHAGYMYRDAFSSGQIARMENTLNTWSADLTGTHRPNVLVDCDGDLIDDVEEILAGNEIDENRDLVPDGCQTFANPGDLIVSGMHNGLDNRPRYFDGTTGAWRGDLWSGAWWTHQFRLGPDDLVYMTSLTVVQRLSLRTGRLVDNFIDGVLEGAGTFVDLLFDDNDDLLVLDNVSRNIRRYSGVDGSFMGQFATLAPVGMTSPKYMEYGPDGNIYIVGNGAQGNTIQMIDRQTGANLGSFITPGLGGLFSGQGLTFHDGFLYVSNGASNNVLKYNATNGSFQGLFVGLGSGGLSNPHSLRFGPDGNLYVASRSSNSVKRYNGSTGAYMGNFVQPGAGGSPASGGVTAPTGLLFVTTGTVAADDPRTAKGFALRGSAPNPFSSATTIRFDVPRTAAVDMHIFDVRGRRIRTLAESQEFTAGRHQLTWNGRDDEGRRAAPGVYFYEMRSDKFRTVRRTVLLR